MNTADPTTCPWSKRPAAISVLRQTSPVTQRQNGWIRRLRRLLVILLVFIALGVCVWSGREPILRGVAHLWIASDPVTQADAAVVLGGGLGSRPFAAAELYKLGLVKKVLISRVKEDRAVDIGAVLGHTESNRQVLLKLGVPASAIEIFGNANKNTREEAVAVREWAERNGALNLIVPTEDFTTRRVRWIFRREFAGLASRIEVQEFEPSQYSTEEWWKTEQGLIAFQNEVLKYIYYRMKY
jgi:uncharacterized SAM-binding protein YcdF (DUF218 family)